jgi:two-component system response regulator FixJ
VAKCPALFFLSCSQCVAESGFDGGDIDGIELLKRLKTNRSLLPVVIMTGHGDVQLAVEAMKLGAVDFLEKPFEDERIIGMIDVALRQAQSNAQDEAMTHDIASRMATLSPRERQVMDGLIAGLSNKLIARDYEISPRTIEVYRANVMTKMRAGSLSELVRLANPRRRAQRLSYIKPPPPKCALLV